MKATFFTSLLLSLTILSLTSCAIYQQDFDYQPPVGVPCTSETDLESMVVETNKGPDLFVPMEKETESKSKCACHKCQGLSTTSICSDLNRKVWICHHLTEDGCSVQGHYIYQKQILCDKTVSPCSSPGDLEEDSKVQFMIN